MYDLKQMKIIYEIKVDQGHLIGRLTSGLFDVVDGHIYFGNSVIKVRHDLINSQNRLQFTQTEIFDYYSDIFEFPKNLADASIKSDTPLNSIRGHRFAYILADAKNFTTK